MGFHNHETIGRWFSLLHSGLVCHILASIVRWKCVACGRSFRHLPGICCRYKRYLPHNILKMLSRYLEDDSCSYRRAARHSGMPVPHAGKVATADSSEAQKQSESSQYFRHTTPYRWLAFFAGLEKLFSKLRERTLRLVDLLDFNSLGVAPHKYRGDARKAILVRCRRLIRCLNVLKNYSPDFATPGTPP